MPIAAAIIITIAMSLVTVFIGQLPVRHDRQAVGVSESKAASHLLNDLQHIYFTIYMYKHI